MKKRLIFATLSSLFAISLILVMFSVFAVPASAATVSFTINPIVFMGGGGEYNIVWKTNVNSIGYVTYTSGGKTYTVYDEQNGIVRTDDSMHSVRVPQEQLDKATSYTVVSKEVKSRSGYSITLGTTVQKTQNFKGYAGDNEVTFAGFSDTHIATSTLSSTISFTTNLMKTTHANADVIILNGDIIGDCFHTETEFYALFEFAYAAGCNGTKPVLFVVGNHEKRGFYSKEIEKYLTFDTGEFYGRVDFGPASIIVLDSGEDKADDVINYGHDGTAGLVDFNHYFDEQIEWAKSMGGYNPSATYTFSVSHWVGPFCRVYRDADIRAPLTAYGTQMVLGGHNHHAHQWENPWGKLTYPGYILGHKDGTGFVSSSITCKNGNYTITKYNKSGGVCSCSYCAAYGTGSAITYTPTQKATSTYSLKGTEDTTQTTQTEQTPTEPVATNITTAYGASTTAVKSTSSNISIITKPVVFDSGYYYSVVWQTTSGVKCGGYVEVSGDTSYWNASHGGKLRTESTHSVRIPKTKLAGKTYTVKNRTISNYNAYGFYNNADVGYGAWVSGTSVTMSALPNNNSTKFTALAVANKTGGKSAATELLAKYSGTPNLLVMLGDMAPQLETEADFGKYILEYAAEVTGGKYPVVFCRGEGESKGAFAANISRFIRVFTGDGAIAGLNTDYAYGNKFSFIALDTATKNADSYASYNGYAKFDTIRQEQATWLEQQIPASINKNYNLVFANATNLSNCVGVNFAQNFERVGTHLAVSAGSGNATFTKGGHEYSQATVGNALGLVLTCANDKIKVESISTTTSTLGEVNVKTTDYSDNHVYQNRHDSTNHYKECTVCNDIIDHRPANYVQKHDGTKHWSECSVCGEKLNETAHILSSVNAKKPTCTQIGWDAYVYCSCGYTTYAEKAATGHTIVNVDAKAPTCTQIGWDAYEHCTVCDYTTYVEKAATGHTLKYESAKEPTCTEIGWSAYEHCTVCDYTTYAEKAIKDHTLKYENAKKPTCTQIGWDAYEYCTVCSYTTYAEKSATGHTIINVGAKNPTCTKVGWEAYEYCSSCDYTTYVEKSAKGHTIINVDAKAPTCTENGWDAYEYCSVCNYTTYAKKSATGHTIVNVDAKAPTCTQIGWEAYEHCTVCSYTTYAEIKATGHSASTEVLYNQTSHYNECSVCGDKLNIEAHKFTNDCDTTCNSGCGYERTTAHDYQNSYDTAYHYQECSICNDKINIKSHKYSNACDATCDCGYVRTVEGHKYQPKFDANNHFSECATCGDRINTEAHKFDNSSDTVCDCGYDKTSTHNYVNSYDSTHHYKICVDCGDKINVDAHKFTNDCDATCNSDCGYERETDHEYHSSYDTAYHYDKCDACNEKINVKSHKYSNACDTTCDCGYVRTVGDHNLCSKFDNDNHYSECTICGDKINIESHKFTNGCDTTCNSGCGYERTTTHDYQNSYDTLYHYDECSICSDKINIKSHKYSNACDATCDCGYVRTVKDHDHKAKFDSDSHYKECSICGDKINIEAHEFENACDTNCDCGYTRAITHDHKVAFDAANHYKECSVCGNKINIEAHEFENACDTNCDCGYTREITHTYSNSCDTTCNVCGNTRVTSHSFGAYVYNNNATTSADGTKTRKCSVCGHSETITAAGTKLPAPAPAPVEKPIADTTKIFTDVAQDWYTTYVNYAYTYNIFKGNVDGTFKPLANITRAEFVQVLANLSNVDTSNKQIATKFSDVGIGDWFSPAVRWANDNGIVSGYGAEFKPQNNITREQMCVMIVNYAKYRGISLKVVEAKEAFADDWAISSWAKDAVYACQMADIVNGKGGGVFDPQGTGLRAEACVIFTKFHKAYLK